ncbi:Chromatin complexes subunit BAP18 [Lamellibrachia satsuma]|nr:Chromatin complexes subunit BAP18 [Lamellibrachia satsuma]
MSSANKVGEIFSEAGNAFSKLGELTMQLHPQGEPSPLSGKWTDSEIEMLKSAVKRFGEDLNKISDVIKNRSISQIKAQMKRKAYIDAGLVKQDKSPLKKLTSKQTTPPAKVEPPVKKQKTAEVTLSALNAPPEGDVDIDGSSDQHTMKKLEFDSDVDTSIL